MPIDSLRCGNRDWKDVVAMIRPSLTTMLLAVFSSLICGDARGTPTETQRYPFDPACAWGRVSDGRGLIVRCLTKDESERLSKGPAPNPPASTTSDAVAPGAGGSGAAPAPATSSERPGSVVGAGDASGGSPIGSGPTASTAKDTFLAELVSVTADEGELPLAKKKLSAPLDRYAKCVTDNGGLTAATGQVTVRFLVRERGRAEGASPDRFQGLTEAAATCIAQVIDRRPTGVPEAPVVGATALIRIRKRLSK
jgi:hypothetical protein